MNLDDSEFWAHFEHDSGVAEASKPDPISVMYQTEAAVPEEQTDTILLEDSVISRMYASEPAPSAERAIPVIPGLQPGQVLNMHTLLKMIVALQAQVAEQERTVKKLTGLVTTLTRSSKTTGRSIDDLYHEMDRKVNRKD